MLPHSHRKERLADQIRDEIAEMVAGELKDPRIGLATVTRVELSADLRHARVLVSVLGDDPVKSETLEGLDSAAGYVRRELARRLSLRHSPEVLFVLDRGPENEERVERLLGNLKGQSSSMSQEAAASATPASEVKDISGVLIMDKPAGLTSHDVVAAVRRLLHIRQIGHFGTLDPFATGVLPLSVGKATRFAQFYLKSRKAYEGVIHFGFATDTYDATGKPASAPVSAAIDSPALEAVLRSFTGRILQTPPPFSAKRVAGTRAYKLARQHKPVSLAPVEVEIYALELVSLDSGLAHFAVECSGGTYVRSLAHDVGQKLGVPAHLASLRRSAVAEFTGQRAVTLDALEAAIREDKVASCLVPLESLLPGCPELVVRGREEKSVLHGHSFELAQAMRPDRGQAPGRAPAFALLKILNSDRRLIAIARHVSGSIYHPDLVLA